MKFPVVWANRNCPACPILKIGYSRSDNAPGMAAGFFPTLFTRTLKSYTLVSSTSALTVVRQGFSAGHTTFTRPLAESVTVVPGVRDRGLLHLAAIFPDIFMHIVEHARTKLPEVRKHHASLFDDSEHLASQKAMAQK